MEPPLLLLFLYSNPSSFSSQTNRACTSPQPCQQKGSTAFFPLYVGLSKRARCNAQPDWMLRTRDTGQLEATLCTLTGISILLLLSVVGMSHHTQGFWGCSVSLILSLVDCTTSEKMQASITEERGTSRQPNEQLGIFLFIFFTHQDFIFLKIGYIICEPSWWINNGQWTKHDNSNHTIKCNLSHIRANKTIIVLGGTVWLTEMWTLLLPCSGEWETQVQK